MNNIKRCRSDQCHKMHEQVLPPIMESGVSSHALEKPSLKLESAQVRNSGPGDDQDPPSITGLQPTTLKAQFRISPSRNDLLLFTVNDNWFQDDLIDEDDCATPKRCGIPKRLVCPPAPRKPSSKRRRTSFPPQEFFVPADLVHLPEDIKALFRSTRSDCNQ